MKFISRTSLVTIFTFSAVSIGMIFLTATTYTQLTLASLFYAPLVVFALKLFPRKAKRVTVEEKQIAQAVEANTQSENVLEVEEVIDIDKRAFLKLIGVAGLSLFIFSLFSRRGEGLFFGRAETVSLQDPEGNKIHPAEQHPTGNYQITQIDDSYIAFYGFMNTKGNWYVMKVSPDDGSIRYSKGETDFASHWAKRTHLKFDYYDKVFYATA